ncbi:MAG TPA: LptF/LptG family permease, partial [Lacipirellulaceae bacterium]|nr:LptF/LptG family permease [Lacipirellulaceae bacterium]
DVAVSWGVAGVQHVFLASIEEVIYGQLRTNHTFNLGKVSMTVRDLDGRRLLWPTLVVQQAGGKAPWTVSAREAELELRPEDGQLVAKFHDVELDGPITYEDPDTVEYVMSVEDLTGSTQKNKSPSNYALSEITPAVHEQEQVLQRVRQSNIAQAAFGMITGDFDSLSSTSWKPFEKELDNANERLYRLHTEPWRRWANGFSCLCFVLIGIPVSIRLRFSEFIASFFICFLPILVVYYPLLVVSVSKAKDGVFPPQSVWLGNLVLAIVGVWLLSRENRH